MSLYPGSIYVLTNISFSTHFAISRIEPHNRLLRISIWCALMSAVEDDLLGSIESEESPSFRHDFALYTYRLTQG